MPTGATSVQVVNSALELIGAQTQITSLADGSVAANAANAVYQPLVQLLLRQLDPDFARLYASLATGTAFWPWTYGYVYPSDCLRARQVVPPPSGAGSLADPNDPQPVRWQVGIISGSKVIGSFQQNAALVYTTSTAGVGVESAWDSAFLEAVTRRLANPLALAIAGRPDYARELLEESERYAGMSELVDESAMGKA